MIQRLGATAAFAAALVALVGVGHDLSRGHDCLGLVVASSQEKFSLLQSFAADFNSDRISQQEGGCVQVTVEEVDSGDAERQFESGTWQATIGRRPDVWSPASSAWVALLVARSSKGAALIPPAEELPRLFESPLVIGMPAPIAAQLGYPEKPIGWVDILRLTGSPGFRLGKTDPTVSTSGLHALMGTYFALTKGDVTIDNIAAPGTRAGIAQIEAAVVHYGETASTFLTNLRQADSAGRATSYVSAIAAEEKEIFDYDRGRIGGVVVGPAPKVPLVAVYPTEGTPVADHPYILLTWSSRATAAAAFYSFVESQTARIQDAGFRNDLGVAGAGLASDADFSAVIPVRLLPTSLFSAALPAMLQQWKELRKRASVLILVDVARADGGPAWAGPALASAIGGFGSGDRVGLWTFPSALGASKPYTEQYSVTAGTATSAIGAALTGLQPVDGTADVDAVVAAAIAAMSSEKEGDRIDAILLVSGQSIESASGDEALERALANQLETSFTRLFVLAPKQLGSDARARLASLALAGQGNFYQGDPAHLARDVISNF